MKHSHLLYKFYTCTHLIVIELDMLGIIKQETLTWLVFIVIKGIQPSNLEIIGQSRVLSLLGQYRNYWKVHLSEGSIQNRPYVP